MTPNSTSLFLLFFAILSACSNQKEEKENNAAIVQDSLQNVKIQQELKAQQLAEEKAEREVQNKLSLAYYTYQQKLRKLKELQRNSIAYTISVDLQESEVEESEDYQERNEKNGMVKWLLDSVFNPLKMEISNYDRYVSSGGEEAYEELFSLLTAEVYYINKIPKLVTINGFIGRVDSTLISFVDDVYHSLDLTFEIPTLEMFSSSIDFGKMEQEENKQFIVNALSSDEMKVVPCLRLINKNISNLQKSINLTPEKFSGQTYLFNKSENESYFDHNKVQTNIWIRSNESSFSVMPLVDHLLRTSGKIKSFPYDTITHPSIGTKIPTIQIGEQVWTAVNSGFEYPDRVKGKRYKQFIEDGGEKPCPKGWHIPSLDEWMKLINELGGLDKAGRAMVTDNPFYWRHANDEYNASGFNIVQNSGNMPRFMIRQEKGKPLQYIGFDGSSTVLKIDDTTLENPSYSCRCVKD